MTTVWFLAARCSIPTPSAEKEAMKKSETNPSLAPSTLEQASHLFAAHQQTIYKSTDRMFAVLVSVQWLAGVIAALWIAPRTWIGTSSQTHIHVWAAVFLGGAISFFPIVLAISKPGANSTRYVIATAQMLMSALLIYLTGGRIETHFHVFGSLAFLAFYRDWRVLVPATIVIAADHFLRGLFWPQSVYGVLSASQWRWLEHAGWVLFEDTFLYIAIRRSVAEMWDIAVRTAEMSHLNQSLEQRVAERTIQLTTANDELQKEIAEGMVVDAALRDSEARYRLMFDSNPLPLWVYDLETLSFLAVNNAAVHHYGYSSEEFLAMTVRDIRPSEDVPALLDTVAKLSEGLDNTGKWRHRKKDGSIIDVEITSHRLEFGGRLARIVLAVDITERESAEKALQESQQWLTAVYESSRDGIIVEESEQVVFVNQSYAHLFGYEPDELTGKPVWLVSEQEPSERMLEYSRRRVRGEEAPSLYEFRGTRKDGMTVDLEASVSTAKIAAKTYIISLCRDITERKVAEAALRLSEQRYRMLFERNLAGVFLSSIDGQILDCNEAFAKIFGYNSRHEALAHKAQDFYVESEDRTTYLERLRNQGLLRRFEHRMRNKDGSPLWVIGNVTLIESEDDSFIQGTLIDITESKQAEAEILLQRARFQQLLEHAPLGILRVDQNDIVLDANKEFEDIFQFFLDEMRGRPINEIVVPKAHREEGMALSSRVLGGEIIDLETIRQRKDGVLIPVQIYGVPILVNGESVGLFAIYVDLSERKLAEEAVARKTHELSEFVEHATVGIHWVGPDGIVQLVNRAELELLGYTREEVIGHHIAEFHADQHVIQDILDRLNCGETIQEYAARLRCKDGTIKDVLIDSSVLWKDGKLVHTRCFTRDITERKRMENERQIISEIIQGVSATS